MGQQQTTMDYAKQHRTKREELRLLLWDLKWHAHHEVRLYGGVRYSARLLELKRLGYEIEDEPIANDNGKRYRLKSHTKGEPKQKMVKVYLTEQHALDISTGHLSPVAQRVVEDALRSFLNNKEKL